MKKNILFTNSIISKLSDEELLISHKESDKNFFARELFIRYLPLIYGVCLKYLKDADTAYDAVIKLFEILLFKIVDYEINSFRPWIYSVTKNHCIQTLQKEEHFITVDFNNEVMESDKIMYLLENENQNEQTMMLKNCMKKLPEQQRLSTTYFFMDKLSYAEIADKTGYTLKHVKSYIQKGKENLKLCLDNNDQ